MRNLQIALWTFKQLGKLLVWTIPAIVGAVVYVKVKDSKK